MISSGNYYYFPFFLPKLKLTVHFTSSSRPTHTVAIEFHDLVTLTWVELAAHYRYFKSCGSRSEYRENKRGVLFGRDYNLLTTNTIPSRIFSPNEFSLATYSISLDDTTWLCRALSYFIDLALSLSRIFPSRLASGKTWVYVLFPGCPAAPSTSHPRTSDHKLRNFCRHFGALTVANYLRSVSVYVLR